LKTMIEETAEVLNAADSSRRSSNRSITCTFERLFDFRFNFNKVLS
jgi:hypothetical protein